MVKHFWQIKIWAFIYLLALVGCSPDGSDHLTSTADLQKVPPNEYQLFTHTPQSLEPSDLPDPITIDEAISTSGPDSLPTPTQRITPTSPYPCSAELCTYPGHFWLERPITPIENDLVDSTYRYGSTQEGNRPTHHGVEFVNPEGTPVLAAEDGLVVVAGTDYQETYADFPFYYGNLVVIEHRFPDYELAVFTLYGHLSNVSTQVGAYVSAGDQIGSVGYTGVAEWSHLHFEVRVEDNLYRKTRNPELWLKPHENEQGELNGAIAGRIIDEFGSPIYIPNIVIERLSPGDDLLETIYVESYADFTVNGDNAWGENFAVGDLAPGKYRVSFVARGLQIREVIVYPGQLTLLTFDAREL
jgi:murein DD-endopeptidase MepM/ murein hydrolase activator NlpD